MSQHFTPAELDAIETLDDKATPAPWRMADHLGRCGDIVAVDDPGASLLSLSYEGGPMIENEDDVRLLVAMRNALERLGRELRRCWALLEPVPGKVEHRAFECKGTCGATTPHKRPFKSAQPWACAGCGALQRESRIVTMEELVYYDGPQLVLFEHPDGALYVGSLIGAHRSGMRFIAARIQPEDRAPLASGAMPMRAPFERDDVLLVKTDADGDWFDNRALCGDDDIAGNLPVPGAPLPTVAQEALRARGWAPQPPAAEGETP